MPSPFVGFVSFEFPESVAFPCLPVPVEGSMVYPRTSGGARGVWAMAPEVWLALKLGARITCQIGHFGRTLRLEDGSPSRLLRRPYKTLLDDRAQAKKEFGKKSFLQTVLKLMANSPYGKLAQGVMGQRGWDAWAQERDEVGGSAITLPWHACGGTIPPYCLYTTTTLETALKFLSAKRGAALTVATVFATGGLASTASADNGSDWPELPTYDMYVASIPHYDWTLSKTGSPENLSGEPGTTVNVQYTIEVSSEPSDDKVDLLLASPRPENDGDGAATFEIIGGWFSNEACEITPVPEQTIESGEEATEGTIWWCVNQPQPEDDAKIDFSITYTWNGTPNTIYGEVPYLTTGGQYEPPDPVISPALVEDSADAFNAEYQEDEREHLASKTETSKWEYTSALKVPSTPGECKNYDNKASISQKAQMGSRPGGGHGVDPGHGGGGHGGGGHGGPGGPRPERPFLMPFTAGGDGGDTGLYAGTRLLAEDLVTVEVCAFPDPVVPTTPVVEPAQCGPEDEGTVWETVTKPVDTEEVSYQMTETDHTVTVTATPTEGISLKDTDGWVLNDDGTATWTYTLQSQDCTVPVEPETPGEKPEPEKPGGGRLPKTGMTSGLALLGAAAVAGGAGLLTVRRRR